jgi:5-methylcytosine-specific restriction protein A
VLGACLTCSTPYRKPTAAGAASSKRWAAFSRRYLREHPLCVSADCALWPVWERPLATEVDHIDGCGRTGARAYDLTNLQALCKSCHARKTVTHDGGFGRPINRLD